jgi:hypothetical protein
MNTMVIRYEDLYGVSTVMNNWEKECLPYSSWPACKETQKKKRSKDRVINMKGSRLGTRIPNTSDKVQGAETGCKIFGKMPTTVELLGRKRNFIFMYMSRWRNITCLFIAEFCLAKH